MYDLVIKALASEFPIVEFTSLLGESFQFMYLNDRVIFLCNISSSLEELEIYSEKVREFIMEDYSKLKEYLSKSDMEQPNVNYIKKYPNLKAFLWDIYIIGIVSDASKVKVTKEQQFMIQRDTYFAQKILVNEQDIESTVKYIKNIISPESEFARLINDSGNQLIDSNIVYYIKNGCLPNQEIPNEEEKIDENSWESIKDIIDYVNSCKIE